MSGRSVSRAGSTFTATYSSASNYGGYNDMVNMGQPPTSGHSNFARASCAVCGEPLTTSFQGEKVIEPPDCPHVMHEQCYKEFAKDFQNCAVCSKPLTIRRPTNGYNGYNKNFGQSFNPSFGSHPPLRKKNNELIQGRKGSISHQSIASASSSLTGRDPIPDILANFAAKTAEPEYEFDHADLEDPIDPCPDPISIPDPRIALYPEHPAITSKSTAQTFTCLLSVEIPNRKTRPYDNVLTPISEAPSISIKSFRERAGSKSSASLNPASPNPKHLYTPKPSVESSYAILEDLKSRISDWHALDTKTFGTLRMWENLKMGVDNTVREVEVYLFENLLLTVKEKNSSAAKQNPKKRKYALKGFIYLEHINRVVDVSAGGTSSPNISLTSGEFVLSVILDSGDTREFTLTFPDPLRLSVWKNSLEGLTESPSTNGLTPLPGTSDRDEDTILRQYEDDRSVRRTGKNGRMSDDGSNSNSSHEMRSSNFATPTTQMTSDFNPMSPRDANAKPVTQRAGIDTVFVVSVAASMHGLKLQILKDALKFISTNLGDYDRMALIVFGGSSGPEVIAGMTRKSIPVWDKAIDALESGPRGVKTEVVEGVNLGIHGFLYLDLTAALDMLSKRRATNPITSIIVISDSPAGGAEPVDQSILRANGMEYIHS
jgi:Mg-chelatase subunit ChlD